MFRFVNFNISFTFILLTFSLRNKLKIITNGKVILQDPLRQTAVELSAKNPTCKMYSDKKQIEDMMSGVGHNQMFITEPHAINNFMHVCRNYRRGSFQSIGFIYPGTKWCGQGNVAQGYNDLGEFEQEDRCCRNHDHCPTTILAGGCYQKLCNQSPYTRSHCDCDKEFRECLKTVNSETSNTLGVLFFNIANMSCFKERCNRSECWLEYETMPTYEDQRKNKYRYLPGQDILSLIIRTIKNVFFDKVYKILNVNSYF